ncbi:hypothetical protein PSAC2689_100063 [Paraburkholderia sacchari]
MAVKVWSQRAATALEFKKSADNVEESGESTIAQKEWTRCAFHATPFLK